MRTRSSTMKMAPAKAGAEIGAYVGLDVHKATIAAAVAEIGRGGEVRFQGEIRNEPEAVRRLAAKLATKHGRLSFCYEAGPCGYVLHRQLTELGHACDVVAPSLIPTKPGDQIKTDRRDAVMLAKLHRAGELTTVWIPDAAHEAIRDLVRARAAAVETVRRARQQVLGFLLRIGRPYPGVKHWGKAHRSWLAGLKFDHPAHAVALEELVGAVRDAEERRDRLRAQIEDLVPGWTLAPVVRALMALRGIALLTAVTLAAEIGDFTRFPHPRQFMAYLGLVPSEASSGPKIRRGGITKAGNAHARKALVEGAWTYRMPARITPAKVDMVDAAPKAVQDLAWKAQLRLTKRWRTLAARGKPKTVVVTAIARELAGFVWAAARLVQTAPAQA